MTFQDFWNQNRRMLFPESTYSTAELAWNAATAAERKRCREIAEEHERYASEIGRDVANSIAEEIGE